MTRKKLSPLFVLLILFCFGASAQVKAHRKVRYRSLRTTIANGKVVYTQICLACHMADGGGVPHMNPPLINTTYVLGNKTTLVKIVLNGFKEDVEINGQTYSNNMTPHAELKDQQIADVLTYVRKSFGNRASMVTAAEVRKVRALNKK
jgi:mono/diheme cytochrome c family protein